MKIALLICSLLGASMTIFGIWGTKTEAGRRKFDEMAGMIPMGSLFLGIIFLVVSLIITAALISRK